MRKITFLLIFIIFFMSFSNDALSKKRNARITIILKDKSDNPLKNLSFGLYDSKGALVNDAMTNEKGSYKGKLPKGDNYQIRFMKEKKEWKFNLSVPDKPGPRSYKYSFKVFVESRSEIVYKAKTAFDEEKDKNNCETTIRLRDKSGLALPNQPFIISSNKISYKNDAETNIHGEFKALLPKGNDFDIVTDIEGYKFNTNLNIPKDLDLVVFNFDIDFQKISNMSVDTTVLDITQYEADSLKTTIRIENIKGELVDGAEVIIEESNKRVLAEMTDKTGMIVTQTQRNKVYELFVRKNAKTYKYEIVLPSDKSIKEFTYTAIVDFTFIPKRTFVLNINFNTAKYDLRPVDVPEMEGLYKQMADNPKMIIEIGGHTDWVGTEESNQILSENRAKTCRNFLIERGIDPSRLSHRGYGEMRPIATNKTAKGRFLNRRTEVSVLAE